MRDADASEPSTGLTRRVDWRRRPLPRGVKPAVWVLWLTPLGVLIGAALTDNLGANPAEALIRDLGDWALRALCLALLVTPLRLALAWPALGGLRRLLGLFAAAYAAWHALAYVWLDQAWDWAEVWLDVLKRPFITVGVVAAVGLMLMAVTSPQVVRRRLGPQRWQRLHHSVYLVAVLAILHFAWMRAGKQDFAEVWVWGSVAAVLLASRWPPLRARLQAWGNKRSRAH